MDDETRLRLLRHLAGESTPEEDAALRDALDEENLGGALGTFREIWSVRPPPPDHADVERGVEKLLARTGLDRSLGAGGRLNRHGPRIRAGFLLRAAVLAGLSVVGIEALERTTAPVSGPGTPMEVLAPPRTVETARGESRRVVLSDGSRVFLAPASRVRFPTRFGPGVREVRLEGRAFFDVVRDESRPFRVRSGEAVTRVLGTRFAVRAYPEEREIRVAVDEGVVAVRDRPDARSEVVLEGGDLGIVDAGGARAGRGGAGSELAWTQGRLVFRAVPVSQVLPELGRWFDVDFSADARLLDRIITTSVGTESLEQVIAILTTALEARADVEEGAVRLVAVGRDR